MGQIVGMGLPYLSVLFSHNTNTPYKAIACYIISTFKKQMTIIRSHNLSFISYNYVHMITGDYNDKVTLTDLRLQ